MKSANRHYLCKSEVFGGAWGGKVGKDENCHGSCFGWHTRWPTRSGKNTRRKWNQFCSRNVQVLKWTLQFQRQWFIFSCRCFRCMADKFCALSVSGDTKSIMNYSLDDSLVKKWKYLKGKGGGKAKRCQGLYYGSFGRLTWPGRETLNLLSMLKLTLFSRQEKMLNHLRKTIFNRKTYTVICL